MKLLFIVENNEPHASAGGYYAVFRFADFLARRGHDAYVYAVHDLAWVRPGRGLRVRYRPSVPRGSRVLRKLDKLLAGACDHLILERAARAVRPDWVLGVFKESAIKATALGPRHGARVANFIYECPPWLRQMAGEERFAREHVGYTRRLWEETRKAYLDSDVLFPNSALSRSYNMSWLGGKEIAEPIFPGVDPDEMPLEAEGESPPPRPRILYVGRLAPAKNVHLLVQAFRALPSGIELHICGEGPERDRLLAMAAGRDGVFFHGYLRDPDLWSQYRRADLVVYPSSFEGFGMPPMQALYFGKPCLVSDLPVFRSVFADHVEYFPEGDAARLADEIRRLLADTPYRERRGRAGRAFVLGSFTWAESARRIEAALLASGSREGRAGAVGR